MTQKINYVIFDLFGTLVKYGLQHRPFRQLLKWARENGRPVKPDDARTIMTTNGNIEYISAVLNIEPPDELLALFKMQIEIELENISLFDDVMPTIEGLVNRGIKIGLCSNLAQPYGDVIPRLLKGVELECFLSYELSAIKPETQIYEAILQRFCCAAEECLFVGDTFEADFVGPKNFEMNALHLVRGMPAEDHQVRSLYEVLDFINECYI